VDTRSSAAPIGEPTLAATVMVSVMVIFVPFSWW
jgi:hypothetical protein